MGDKKVAGKPRRKLKKEVVTTLVIFAVIIFVVLGIIIYKSINRFNYEESLSETVISMSNNTVSGCEINVTLKEIGYYIIEVENKGQETALIYNENNPLEYWNLYLNENMTSDSGYITDIAKRSVITYCVRDNIYSTEAKLNGFELSDEQIEDIKFDAQLEYTKLSIRAREKTGLTAEDYERIYMKEQLAHEYMLYLASDEDVTKLEAIVVKYDVGGTYYDELLKQYDYSVNDELWENVRIGHVTIN